MAIAVIQTEEDKLTINGKLIYKDGDGKWITGVELTTAEKEAFHLHIRD